MTLEDPYAHRLPGDEESLGVESTEPMARVADRPPASRSQSPSNLSGIGNQNFEALAGEIPNAADIAMLLDKVSRRAVSPSAAQSFSPSAAPPSHLHHSMSVPVHPSSGIVRHGSKRMALPPPIDMHAVMQESQPRRKTFAAIDIHEVPERRPSIESMESRSGSSADNNSRSGSSGSASPTAHSPTNESSDRHAKHHKSSHSSHRLTQWDKALARSEKKKREAEMQKQELIDQSIHAAARYGDLHKLKEHLSKPDTLNQQDKAGFSPLHFAACYGHTAAVDLLLETKAVVDATNEHGWTPLQLAARNGLVSCVTTLLNANASVSYADKQQMTALHNACCAQPESLECVQQLLENGATCNSQDVDGWTSLHFAARFNNCATVVVLIEHDADPNIQDRDGWTAMHNAARNGRNNCVKELLTIRPQACFNADPLRVTRYGETVLHIACRKGRSKVVTYIVSWATSDGDDKMLKKMLEVKDHDGKTPMDCAADETIRNILKREHAVGYGAHDAQDEADNNPHAAQQVEQPLRGKGWIRTRACSLM